MQKVPIGVAKHLADAYDLDQVVIIGRKAGVSTVVSYGVGRAHGTVAARIGDFLRFQLLRLERPHASEGTVGHSGPPPVRI